MTLEFCLNRKVVASTLVASVLATGIGAAPASEMTPLREEEHINNSLIAAGIGEMIRRNCGSISPRWFVVYRKTKALEKYALNLGYSEAEIEAFLEDENERDRVRKAVNDYLVANGVRKGEEATYCALGRKEIAARTLTGQLLWSR